MYTQAIDILYSAKMEGIEIVLNEDQLQLKLPRNKVIDKKLLEEIKNHKQLIIEFFKNHKGNGTHKVNKANRASFKRLPLSFGQERLWFIDQLEGSVLYHMAGVLRLKGLLDTGAFAAALQGIVNRHEVLRTVYREQDGEPEQVIREKDRWQLHLVDGFHYQNDPEGLQLFTNELIHQPFDLAEDSMLRVHLIAVDHHEHVLVLVMHHIASDGWSEAVFVRELVALYDAAIHKREAQLQPLPVQYADYAIWQRQYLQGEFLERKLQYWKEKLSGVSPLQLPTDFPRPVVQSTKGAVSYFTIPRDLKEKLQQLSQQQGTTLFMTLLAAFKVLLYRYSGQEDICVGTPTANRTAEEIEDLIGFFVNTLALRSEVRGELSFTDLLQQVKTTTLEAYEHADVPFEKVVEVAVKERDLSRSPLFQVMMVWQNTPQSQPLKLGEVEVVKEAHAHTTAKFDLTLSFKETLEGLSGTVEYCTDLFSGETIARLMTHFRQLLFSLAEKPAERVGKLRMLSGDEEQQLLVAFNDTATPYPSDKTVIELFEEQAAKTPDSVALVFEEKQLTYRELNERANQLAHHLLEKGVRVGSNVALLSYRNLEMIIGIFGILKAGGAYVPMNIGYPPDRLKYIIKDAGIMHVVYTDASLPHSSELREYVCINIKESFTGTIQGPDIKTAADGQIYLMYTSGTTGRPKGIAVNNRNVVKLVYEPGVIAVQSTDRMLQWSNYAFDGSVYEIFCSLLKGASLHLIKDDWASDVHELSKKIKDQNLTVCFLTTALFNTFVDINPTAFQGMRKILFGGEKVSPAHVQKALSAVGEGKIVHVYGPTETTVYATYYPVNSISENNLVPIGKPLANTKLLVLSKDQQLVPISVPGELYIGGEAVSLGYLNHPELTQDKFIQDPFRPGERLYRTGDVVRWLPDGNIEYLGRMDDQVKIRGYRIEPSEIEDVLLESELVSQVVVLTKEDDGGNKHLVGYVVPKIPAGPFNREAVIAYLVNRLPEYMVPAQWVALESLPLNANGKVDKAALPKADLSTNLSKTFVAPSSDAEQVLADIWKELLHLDQVGVHDNFFELGGHSLIIVRILDRVRKLGYEMTAKDFFTYQTIAQQSKFIFTTLMLINATRETKCIIPIHSGRSTNIPLFALPDYLIYCKLAKYIDEDQPFYSAEKSEHLSEMEAAAYYINEIKRVYPRGPYCLVGFCRWAGIALEMAHQLRAQGEEVPVLILIEYYPNGSRLSRSSMRYITLGIRRFYRNFSESPTVMGKAKFVYNQLQLLRRFFFNKSIKKTNVTPVFNGAPFKPYSGKVVIMSAKEAFLGFKKHSEMNWGERFTGDIESFYVDGDHLGVFFNEGPARLGEKINALMEQVNKSYQAKEVIVEDALIEN